MAAVSPVTEVEELTEVKVVAPPPEAVIHVAVGERVKESELTLRWALHNCEGRRICIIHVHQPAQKIPIMGAKFPISQFGKDRVRAYHDAERRKMQTVLEKYMSICEKSGMHAEKLIIEMNSIEEGIIELIQQHGIGKLVMGAAANKSYLRRMIEPKSKKAIFVGQHAPAFCHISFVCKGLLIHTRESRTRNPEVIPPPQVVIPCTAIGQSSPSRDISSTPENSRVVSTDYRLTPCNTSITNGSIDGWDGISMRSSLRGSQLSSCSSSEMIDNSASIFDLKTLRSESVGGGIETEAYNHYVPPSLPILLESTGVDELDDRLQQFMEDADSSKKQANEESMKRQKAEKQVIEAIHRVKESESMHAEELRKRKETEEALAQGKEEVRRMQQHLSEIMEDLHVAREQNSSLESQIADRDQMVEKLEHQIVSCVDLMQKYKTERDELEVKLDSIAGSGDRRVPLELSDSSAVHNTKDPAYDITNMVQCLMRSTGKAIWIAATSFIIVGLPLIIVRNHEQTPIGLESQQEGLLWKLCSIQ